MEDRIENIDKIIHYWKESSDLNYKTMHNLLHSGDYSWALFLGHLVLEKLLKAHYVKSTGKHPFFTHDLLRLLRKSGLAATEETEQWLDDISTFNLNARSNKISTGFVLENLPAYGLKELKY